MRCSRRTRPAFCRTTRSVGFGVSLHPPRLRCPGASMYLESKNHAGTTAVGGTGGSAIPPWPPTYEFLPDSTGVVGRSGDSGSAVFCKEPEPGEWRFCGLGIGLRTTAWMPPWRTWVRFRINSTPER